MRPPILFALVCLSSVGNTNAADCEDAAAKNKQLTSEVESLRKQLTAAQKAAGQCEISVLGAASKTMAMTSDVIQHLLRHTEVDDHVVNVVSRQVEVVRGITSKAVDQIKAHPCGSDYDKCVKNITGSSIYMTHVAPLVSKAQPHVESAMTQPHVKTALATAKQAMANMNTYSDEYVLPRLKEGKNVAHGHLSNMFSSAPGRLDKLLDPAFGAFATASPKHRDVLPRSAVDRLLLICVLLIICYYSCLLVQLFVRFAGLAIRLCIKLGVMFPLRVTMTAISWGFWFGTCFYVCGLCRKRKKVPSNGKKPTNGKIQVKNDEGHKKESKPATEKELVNMLETTKEKGKLNDGVARLVAAAKEGKCLQAPEDMKGKQVTKDVLKKALSKFKEVNVKKLGL